MAPRVRENDATTEGGTVRGNYMSFFRNLARIVLVAFFLLPGAAIAADEPAAEAPLLHVWKTPTCGCCGIWVDHMRDAGFSTEITDLDDVLPIKKREGVPPRVHSCHTAVVDGYVVEGHVPAEDVKRLLREKPDIVGIAVGGMPAGSPGMESPRPQPYDVHAIQRDGSLSVWASHRP